MAHEALRPAFPGPERQAAVSHARYERSRFTGVLHLSWRIPRAHPVAIGAGWLDLFMPPGKPEAPIADIARRGDERLAVLPGSSLKGAVRQVYELLTPSCRLDLACRVDADEARPRICPACSLFGAGGLAGRAAFGEAVPASDDAAEVLAVPVPTAWPPRKWQPRTVRAYDLDRAVDRQGAARPTPEWTWAVAGSFASRLRLTNASLEELGLLFAALGVGAAGAGIRLGGKRFHGLGAASVTVERADWVFPRTRPAGVSDLPALAGRLARWAVESLPGRVRVLGDLRRLGGVA